MTESAAAGKPAAEISPVTRALSEYIAAALDRPLPGEVVEKAKHHLLDTFAAMISGSRLPPGRLAIDYARAAGGAEQATVVGSRCVTSAVQAAQANGMSAHADETDDSHAGGRCHPGCAIVPAALAAAELAGRDGPSLLRATALGYDVGVRFVLALGLGETYGRPHSTHSLGGLFGAAAAAGALLGLDARQVRWQLSYTVQQASGLAYWMRDPDHIEKAFDFGGMPARNALTAATMVEAGGTGVEDPLAGPRTFLEAFAEQPRPEELVGGLGSRFEIMAASIKKWPAGMPIQAALDALETLMRTHRIAAPDLAELTVRLPDDRAHLVDDRDMPDVCVQHLLALMLLDGGLGFAAAHDRPRMRDAQVLELRQRIRLVPDPALTQALPPRQAIVEIRTADGRTLAERTRAVRGTPDSPMARAEVEAKAHDLLTPVLGAERASTLTHRIWQIERMASVLELRPLLQA
jgi:2-methylcitrate dehydratase PrpD